jgi:hypothetical protein
MVMQVSRGSGGFRIWALNWRPCSLSRTHNPFAVTHSPALTFGNEPSTVTSSRCQRTFTQSTTNPLSELKKVTHSLSPAISSGGVLDLGAALLMLIKVYEAAATLCAQRVPDSGAKVWRPPLAAGTNLTEGVLHRARKPLGAARMPLNASPRMPASLSTPRLFGVVIQRATTFSCPAIAS